MQRVEERIWRDGDRFLRIEVLAPPDRRGEIILFDKGKLQHYFPARKVVEELVASSPESRMPWRKLASLVRRGALYLEPIGQESVAGRRCVILKIEPAFRPGTPPPEGPPAPPRAGALLSQKLWIDKETGLVLRREVVDPKGRRVLRIEFTHITLKSSFPAEIFKLNLPPDVTRKVVHRGHFATVEEAQKVVPFKIRELVLPQMKQRGVYLHPFRGNPIVAVVYVGPQGRLTFFQTFLSKEKFRPPIPEAAPNKLNTFFWERDGYWFGLVGNLPYDQLQRIAGTLK